MDVREYWKQLFSDSHELLAITFQYTKDTSDKNEKIRTKVVRLNGKAIRALLKSRRQDEDDYHKDLGLLVDEEIQKVLGR